MSLTRHLVRGGATAVVGVLALAGCGSDGGSTGAGDTEPSASATVTVTDAWARDTAEGQTNAAIYLTVTNETDADVDVIGASVPAGIATEAQIHESMTEGDATDDSSMDDSTSSTSMGMDDSTSSTSMGMDDSMGDAGGMTTMREVPQITVMAGETVKFEPGGYHVMVMDLDHPLTVGETFPVTLMLDGGGSVKATVTVRSA